MSPSTVGADVGKRLTSAGLQLSRVQRPAVDKAALVLVTAGRAGIKSMAPSGRMSNVGRSGSKVGARYDVKGTNNPSALMRATGSVHLLERKTKAHPIAPKARRARGGRATIRFADGSFRRGPVSHPGTSGKHGFGRAIEGAMPKALDALRKAASDAVIRGFKGLVR